ncbi:helix-turn-helix domain-containing protein [Burkholderia cepacia]|uniref:helix-turn-helix domain-containing protein n=1 Tax=Burkholderia cepacia TaxID=292 RepID=UPI000F5E0DDA|nr:helix-turn-helix domain-containing protein [Burkholderia cepacia]RQZ57440.1 helix-turn-helix domain-containing protein [Burkholderia cepacia]
MSTSLMGACWPLQMSPTQKAVLISLADQANDDGVCWPRIETIAVRTCLSERAVQVAIKWLEEHGVLRLERRYKRSTVFTISPRDFREGESDSPERHSPEPRSPEGDSPERHSPEGDSLSGAAGASSGVQITAFSGAGRAPRITKEPSKEPTGNHQRAKTRGEASLSKFERWWQTWPRSARKVGKADCEKRWQRHGLDEHAEVLIAHTAAMKLTKQWRDGFDPAPATYLNQRRWLDELPPENSEIAAEAGGAPWWESASGIETQGRRVGVEMKPGQPMPDYLVLVAKASGRGPWIEHVLRREKTNAERYQRIVQFFGDGLMPPDWYAS